MHSSIPKSGSARFHESYQKEVRERFYANLLDTPNLRMHHGAAQQRQAWKSICDEIFNYVFACRDMFAPYNPTLESDARRLIGQRIYRSSLCDSLREAGHELGRIEMLAFVATHDIHASDTQRAKLRGQRPTEEMFSRLRETIGNASTDRWSAMVALRELPLHTTHGHHAVQAWETAFLSATEPFWQSYGPAFCMLGRPDQPLPPPDVTCYHFFMDMSSRHSDLPVMHVPTHPATVDMVVDTDGAWLVEKLREYGKRPQAIKTTLLRCAQDALGDGSRALLEPIWAADKMNGIAVTYRQADRFKADFKKQCDLLRTTMRGIAAQELPNPLDADEFGRSLNRLINHVEEAANAFARGDAGLKTGRTV